MTIVQTARDVLTPDALALLQTVASAGSFAAAARTLGVVPSTVTYRVRQLEDVLEHINFNKKIGQRTLSDDTLGRLEK